MADDKKGTVSIRMALEGVAKIERSIADIKKEFSGLGDEVRQIQTQFTSFSKGLNTVMSSAKSGFILGGFDKMKANFKTNLGSFSRFATTALRGTMVGVGITVASYAGDGIKKGLMLYPKLLTSQLSGIYSSVKNVTGFDQFFSASGVIQGSIDLSQYAKQINAEAEQTNIATESVMQYKLAMDMAGVSSDNFGKRISYLGKQLTKAYAGTAPDAMRVLKELQLEEKELMALPIEERFIRVAEAIDSLPDPSKRAHAAMLLFERGGNLMLPLFKNMQGRINETKKVLGDLPQILKQNGDEFTRFANDISLFSVKRQQFFAGFMQAGFAGSANSLMGGILEKDFSEYGRELAGMFERTITAIRKGNLSEFVEAFSEDFANALKKGAEKFLDVAGEFDWGRIGYVIGESSAKAFISIVEGAYSASIEVLSEAYARLNYDKQVEVFKQYIAETNGDIEQAKKNYNLKNYGTEYSQELLPSVRKINEAQWAQAGSSYNTDKRQRELEEKIQNLAEAEALWNDYITTGIEEYENRQKASILALNTAWDSSIEDVKKELNDANDVLFESTIIKDSLLKSWDTTEIQKYDATIQLLSDQIKQKELEITEFIMENSNVMSEAFKKGINGDFVDYYEISGNLKKALEDPLKNFNLVQDLIPVEELENLRKLFVDLSKIRAEKGGMFDPGTYMAVDNAFTIWGNGLKENYNEIRVIQQSGHLTHEQQLIDVYEKEKEQLEILNNEYNTLIEKLRIAEEISDTSTAAEVTRQLDEIDVQRRILASRENPKARIDAERIGRTNAENDARIGNQISRIQNDKTPRVGFEAFENGQIARNRQIRDLYEEQIQQKEEAIKQYQELQATLDTNIPKQKELFDDLTSYVDQLKTDISDIQNMEPPTMFQQMRDDIREAADEMSSYESISQSVLGVTTSMRNDMSDALYDVWAQTKTGSEALEGMWLGFRRAAARAITDTISNFVMSKTVMVAAEQGFNAIMAALGLERTTTTVTQETTAAAAVTTAWTPAAIFKSIATAGVAVAIGMGAMMGIMAMFGGFASGGRVRGGRQLVQINEDGSEYVVSAKSPRSNDKWLDLANEGVDLDEVARRSEVVSKVGGNKFSGSQRNEQQPAPVVKQITVRSEAELHEEWKRGGLIDFVRNGSLRRGWAV